MLVNHYQNLGSFIVRHHLPLKMTCDSPIGKNIIKYWEILKPYVLITRNGENQKYHNEVYANDFEKLYDMLKRKKDSADRQRK
ncbi:MAG: hypothetical protein LBM93_15055 [Oscillospiraceae bacterium]|nr:hypothetical protein [Oscillospiraceae bacterium]